MDHRTWCEEPPRRTAGTKEASVWRCLPEVGWPVPFPRMELIDTNSPAARIHVATTKPVMSSQKKNICTNTPTFFSKIKGPCLPFIFLALRSPGSQVATCGSLLALRWVGFISSKDGDHAKRHELHWPHVSGYRD